MEHDKYVIPRYLDEPPRWLLWTLDEAIALLAPLLLGLMIFNHMMLGFVIGIVLMVLLKKLKGTEGHHFLMGLVYWYFPGSRYYLKATPDSFIREYLG